MKSWRDIPGWCDYDRLYAEQVASVDGGWFVEVGTWVGRSTCCMAQLIKDSGKPIRFDAIDHGMGSPELMEHMRRLRIDGTTIEESLISNIVACGLMDYVHVRIGDSCSLSDLFPPQSLDFVFIDGDHRQRYVRRDVQAYLPKIRPGGVLAGHDWSYGDVQQGVLSVLPPESIRSMPWCDCWIYEAPDASQ